MQRSFALCECKQLASPTCDYNKCKTCCHNQYCDRHHKHLVHEVYARPNYDIAKMIMLKFIIERRYRDLPRDLLLLMTSYMPTAHCDICENIITNKMYRLCLLK